MTSSIPGLKSPAQLRQDAESRLKSRTAPTSAGWVLGRDALALLHSLASSPENAADALKLLHELQTHQIELDLQYEQLESNERALSEDLAYYKALFDDAPVGYLIVSPDGHIVDGNLASADLFGIDRDDLSGASVGSFLAPDSQPTLMNLLRQLQAGSPREHCTVQSLDSSGTLRLLQIAAKPSPGGSTILMNASRIHQSSAD